MSRGVRWAETTRTSYGTSNSASASAAAPMTGQSESLPMITPTTGAALGSGMRGRLSQVLGPAVGPGRGGQPGGGQRGAGPDGGHVVAEERHVADLAVGALGLAVEV